MKKIYYFIILSLMMIFILNFTYMPVVKAADEYTFELNYTGDVVVNEEKSATVTLRGTDATTYARVRIKVDIEGPGIPTLLATDSGGVEHDIAQLGYWGPDAGFAVGGTFENNTPIKATFPTAGTYTITLSLINLDANNSEITSRVTIINVLEDESIVVNEIANSIIDVGNNTIDKLPQTGTSITEYIIYAGIIIAVVAFGYYKINKANV